MPATGIAAGLSAAVDVAAGVAEGRGEAPRGQQKGTQTTKFGPPMGHVPSPIQGAGRKEGVTVGTGRGKPSKGFSIGIDIADLITGFAGGTLAEFGQQDEDFSIDEPEQALDAVGEPTPLKRTRTLPSGKASLAAPTVATEGLTRSQLRAGRLRSRFRF